MAGYKIQLKDKNGNRQYPVSTTNVVVDADGVSVADLLDRKQPTLVSGVNIKTINGKTLLGEGDLVIEGGTADLSGYATTEYVDAKVGESYPVYVPLLIGEELLTDEQKEENKATYEAIRDTWDYFFPHIYLAPNKGISFIPFDNHYDEPVGYVDLLLSVKSLIASVRDLASGSTLEGWEDEKFLADATISIRLYADGNVEVTQEEYFATPSTNVLRAILTYITLGMGGGGASLIPDSEMSDTSTNAVQNKVIKAYVDSKVGGGSGEAAESDVICVIWDDDTSDIPSNKEAYQKLAESINTVGKPLSVMVTVETGFRWGIAKYYWKSNVGGDIELTTPVTESGLYCVFTLTSEGVCTASYKHVDLGGGGENTLENSLGVYVSDNLTAEQIEHNKNAYETYYNATDKPAVYIIGASSQPIGVWQSSDGGVEFLAIDALVYFSSSEEGILYVQTMARWNADGTITEMQGGLRSVPTAEGIKTINGQSLIGKGDLTIGGSSLKEVLFYIGTSLTAEQKATNVASYNAWMQAEGGYIKSDLVFVGGGFNGLVMRPSVVIGKNGNLLASLVMTPMPSSINSSGDYPLKTIWYTIHADGTTNETTNSEL